MADAPIDFQGVDIFDMGSNFKAGAGSKITNKTVFESTNTLGDRHEGFEKEDNITVTCAYEFVGTDLQAQLLNKLAKVYTTTEGAFLLDSLTLNLAERTVINLSLTGHNHTENPHADAVATGTGARGSATEGSDNDFDGFDLDLETYLGTTALASEDCPSGKPFANSNADSDTQSITLNFTSEHVDKNAADGDHFAGRSLKGVVSITVEYVGKPVLTTTGFTVSSEGLKTDNKEFDSYSITASQELARTAVAP